MLGVGWTEMLVIGVVALIVIGPKELPALMQKLGRFAGTVRRMGNDFQREINKTTGLNEVTNLRKAITQPLKTTTDAIRKEFNTTMSSGEVKPSGALAPADPKADSVVDEIHAAAGMKPPLKFVADPVKASITERVKAATAERAQATTGAASFTAIAPSSAAPPPVKAELVPEAKPKRARRKKAETGPVSITELAMPPETPRSKVAPAKRPAKTRRVESPAPAEALAPAAPTKPRRKRAAKKAV